MAQPLTFLKNIDKELSRVQNQFSKSFGLRISTNAPWGSFLLGRTNYDYRSVVGDGSGNSIVASCVYWIARTFPEAPLRVARLKPDGTEEFVLDHELGILIERPNLWYSGPLLWMATLTDWTINGNAYWLKVRSDAGRVVELYYLPQWLVEPRWSEDGKEYVSYYEYNPGDGNTIRIDTKNIVHFRYGIDPQNIRKGRSPLSTVLRQIFSDDEATNFSSALLRNLGIPGVIITPEDEVEIGQQEAEMIKNEYDNRFGTDNRGKPMVLSARVKIQQLSFTPEQMNLTQMHRLPEERVSAALGIPAVVVGLGAGLDRSCVPGYARVQTPYGTKTIDQISAGDIVWSFKDGKIVPRMVEHKWEAGVDTVYKVKTKNRTVFLTDNHPLMVRVAGASTGTNASRHATYEWREVKDIKPGDYIIQAKGYPDQGNTILPDGTKASKEMLQFLGAIVGDGTITPGVGVNISISKPNTSITLYKDFAINLFNNNTNGAAAVQTKQSSFTLTAENQNLSVFSPNISHWLSELGFSDKRKATRVPSWIFSLSKELRLAFLAGIVDTDGTVDSRGALTLRLANKQLVEDIRDIAISCSISCSNIVEIFYKGNGDARDRSVRSKDYKMWSFTVSSAQQVAEIPFSDSWYRERVDANSGKYRAEGFDSEKAGLSSDLGFYKVQEIVPIGKEPVYDLTVEDGHSFFCYNVLVSNTYNNMAEAREAAFEGNIIPTQRLLAAELKSQLLPDFVENESEQRKYNIVFDTSGVRVLQTDQNETFRRVNLAVMGGWFTQAQAYRAVGLPATAEDEYYLRSQNIIEVSLEDARARRSGTAQPQAPSVPSGTPAVAPSGTAELERAENYAELGSNVTFKADNALNDEDSFKAIQIRNIQDTVKILFEQDVKTYFSNLEQQIYGAVKDSPESDNLTISIKDIFTKPAETTKFKNILEKNFERFMPLMHYLLNELIESDEQYDASSNFMQSTKTLSLERLDIIMSTTETVLENMLSTAYAEKWSNAEFKKAVKMVFVDWNDHRSKLITTTELTKWTGKFQIARFRASGNVVAIRLVNASLNENCAARHGRLVSIDEFEKEIDNEHPGGTLIGVPELRFRNSAVFE